MRHLTIGEQRQGTERVSDADTGWPNGAATEPGDRNRGHTNRGDNTMTLLNLDSTPGWLVIFIIGRRLMERIIKEVQAGTWKEEESTLLL